MAATPIRTDIDFNEFRQLLLAERARLLHFYREQTADIRAESEDAAENEPSITDDTAAVLHDRTRDDALNENERELLHRVNLALDRLDEGTYGISEVTGEPIPVGRLRAMPWVTTTVEEAERIIE